MIEEDTVVYEYRDSEPTWSTRYLWPEVLKLLPRGENSRRAIDIGCGNGWTTSQLANLGYSAIGIDPSETGIRIAHSAFPNCRFEVGSTNDDLVALHGCFDLVVSLEVLPVCLDPWGFARKLYEVTGGGGTALISTPYHGYTKNLAIALSDRFDAHFDPLWHSSLSRFFSRKTVTRLMGDVGFRDISIVRVGRIPALAKSMIVTCIKPA
jgi:2-polyprenyl-6-hydroxyphenyl methylase/3-demethylubiquinone-9 3-methyltransferase